ncbi:MAG TPA: radical SAM protein [Elusimicrobiota bacterium]|nr:radical SAM protein [Elusimicrobiota bacterium]
MFDRSSVDRWRQNARFLPARPALWARVMGNYVRMIVLREPCLRVVTVALTYQCQLSCAHCSARSLSAAQSEKDRLTLAQMKTLLSQAQGCGALNIHFTGGEPLLCPDLYDYASLVDTSRNILSCVTNGLLLSRESRRLKRARFDLVIVSIDSPRASVHDRLRGYSGTHRQAWQGIEKARGEGLSVMVAMVVTHENLLNGEVEEQINLCRKENIVLQLLPARAQPLWGKALTPEDMKIFYEMTSSGDPRWDGCSSYFSPRCLAGRERVYVDPTGNVYPCDFIQQSFGNVKNEPLRVIWERMLKVSPYSRPQKHCLTARAG